MTDLPAITEPVVIPDGVTPIRAYRGWNVAEWRGLVRLRSLAQDVTWPTGGPLSAECREWTGGMPYMLLPPPFAVRWITTATSTTTTNEPRQLPPQEDRPPHPNPPHKSCGCGIWGVVDPWQIKPYDWPGWNGLGAQVVVGVVELWGRVVVGTKGWRAQYARPVELVSAPRYPGRSWRKRRALARLEDRVAAEYGIPVFDYWPDITPLEA